MSDEPVALVTGAASGIGRATAIALAEHGFRLVLTDRDEDGLRATGKASVTESATVVADLAAADELPRLAQAVRKRFGRLDALVQIAGIGCYRPFWEVPRDEIERVLATNVT